MLMTFIVHKSCLQNFNWGGFTWFILLIIISFCFILLINQFKKIVMLIILKYSKYDWVNKNYVLCVCMSKFLIESGKNVQ